MNFIQWEFMNFERARRNSGISYVLTNGNGSMAGGNICVSRGDNHAYISLTNNNGLILSKIPAHSTGEPVNAYQKNIEAHFDSKEP